MIKRELEEYICSFVGKMPVIAVTGPRQSGKTTVCRALFPNFVYVTLEDIDTRKRAKEDPRTFLHQGDRVGGIIIDEIQQAGELLSYLQTIVDEPSCKTTYIITGSQNLLLHQAISQSLAGRVRLITLLPLSLQELSATSQMPQSVDQALFYGGYPRIYNDHLNPATWYSDYLATYVERDVRQLQHIIHLDAFQHFIALCAGRIGQLVNMTSLANDCGVSVPTIDAWLLLLQASYIIFLLQPYYKNFNRRLVKSPKLYFYDVGLACSLLKIQAMEQLYTFYARGNLFENLVITEFIKAYLNRGIRPGIYFWRDATGNEVDLIFERGPELCAAEIKTSSITNSGYFDGVKKISSWSEGLIKDNFVIYGGVENQQWSKGKFVSWQRVDELLTP
jgi:hypothetical protein